jgi:hypothetical protein
LSKPPSLPRRVLSRTTVTDCTSNLVLVLVLLLVAPNRTAWPRVPCQCADIALPEFSIHPTSQSAPLPRRHVLLLRLQAVPYSRHGVSTSPVPIYLQAHGPSSLEFFFTLVPFHLSFIPPLSCNPLADNLRTEQRPPPPTIPKPTPRFPAPFTHPNLCPLPPLSSP